MTTSPLFQLTQGETFAQKLASLTELHLDGVFGFTILGRGFTSYDNNCVENVTYSPGQVTARTVGQDVYQTTLTKIAEVIFGECTCPFDGRCKHQAALLIYLIRDADKEGFQELNHLGHSSPGGQNFKQYLDTLEKKELLELVLRFAPESYVKSILFRFSDNETKYRAFLKGQKRVQNIFSRDLYGIGSFEEDLSDATEELKALWPHLPEELTNLYIYIIDKVEKSFEDGYLYDDYSDHAYHGFAFGTHLAEFVAGMPTEKLEKLTPKIWAAILDMGYTTFGNFFWELIDLVPTTHYAIFKQVSLANRLFLSLDSKNQKKYYETLLPVFSETEQKKLLEELSDQSNYFRLKLVEYWEEKVQIDKAVLILNNKLKPAEKENDYLGYSEGLDKLYEKRIDLEELHYKGEETALFCLPATTTTKWLLKPCSK